MHASLSLHCKMCKMILAFPSCPALYMCDVARVWMDGDIDNLVKDFEHRREAARNTVARENFFS